MVDRIKERGAIWMQVTMLANTLVPDMAADFVERQTIEKMDDVHQLKAQMAQRMYERGATWWRFSLLPSRDNPDKNELVLEGWHEWPIIGPPPT
jgi:hypothetical protein